MLINEVGFVRAIKRAYKNGGYTVINRDGKITIYTAKWCVQTSRKDLPRKALAAIVEHMGMIPDQEPVYIIKDEDPQTVMAETAAEDMNRWRLGEDGDVVDMVPVIMQGLQIFQAKDGPCWGIPLPCLSMIEQDEAEYYGATVVDNDRLVWEDNAEVIAVEAVRKAKSGWAKAWEKAVWEALESVDLHKEDE